MFAMAAGDSLIVIGVVLLIGFCCYQCTAKSRKKAVEERDHARKQTVAALKLDRRKSILLLIDGKAQQIGGDTFIRPKGADLTSFVFVRATIVNQRGGSLQLHYGNTSAAEWVNATDPRFAVPGANFIRVSEAAADNDLDTWHRCNVLGRKGTRVHVRYAVGRGEEEEWIALDDERFCPTGDGFSDVLEPMLAKKHWQAARDAAHNGQLKPIGEHSARNTAALILGGAFGRNSDTSRPSRGRPPHSNRRHSLSDLGSVALSGIAEERPATQFSAGDSAIGSALAAGGGGTGLVRKGTLLRLGVGSTAGPSAWETSSGARRRSSVPSVRTLATAGQAIDTSPEGRSKRKRSLASTSVRRKSDSDLLLAAAGGGDGGGGQKKKKKRGKKQKPHLHRTHSEVRRIRSAAGTSYRRKRHGVGRSATAPLPESTSASRSSARRKTRTGAEDGSSHHHSHRHGTSHRSKLHHHHHHGRKRRHHAPVLGVVGEAAEHQVAAHKMGLVAVASQARGLVAVPENEDDELDLQALMMTM